MNVDFYTRLLSYKDIDCFRRKPSVTKYSTMTPEERRNHARSRYETDPEYRERRKKVARDYYRNKK